MFTQIIFIAFAVAGFSALWRTFRYDPENPMNKHLDALPYFLRKPITCGLCFTFWIALLATIVFNPLGSFLPDMRFSLSGGMEMVLSFLFSWMIIGASSALVLYVLDTFFQVSHYYKHETDHEDHESGE